MRDGPSRMSAQATKIFWPDTQAVGIVPTRNDSLGKFGTFTAPRRAMPVAGDVLNWKLSPPSVETSSLISVPLAQIMNRSPLAATLISGENEPLLTSSVPGAVAPLPVPTQVAPWSLVRAKRIFVGPKPSSQTAYTRPWKGLSGLASATIHSLSSPELPWMRLGPFQVCPPSLEM